MAILAGLQILSGSMILGQLFPVTWVGLFSLVVAALQGGTTFYMKADHGPGQHRRSESDSGPRSTRYAYPDLREN